MATFLSELLAILPWRPLVWRMKDPDLLGILPWKLLWRPKDSVAAREKDEYSGLSTTGRMPPASATARATGSVAGSDEAETPACCCW